jgi:hypothetical protein
MINNKPENYTEIYLLSLTPGKWYQIRNVPDVIGLVGIVRASAEQPLLPDFRIQLGRLGATFKIIRMNKQRLILTQKIAI